MKGEGKEGRQGEQWEDKGWKWALGGWKKKRVRKGESKGKGVAGGQEGQTLRWEKKEKREGGEETV